MDEVDRRMEGMEYEREGESARKLFEGVLWWACQEKKNIVENVPPSRFWLRGLGLKPSSRLEVS